MDILLHFGELVMGNLQYAILVLIILVLAALIVFVHINLRLAALNRKYKKMMQGMDDVNLEGLLMEHIEDVHRTVRKVEALSEQCRKLDEVCRSSVQKVAVVRFNAFEDTGSDLSFAIAALDQNDNGYVLSSIYGRNESRIYAKPIQNGQSTYLLSQEEKEALEKARQKK